MRTLIQIGSIFVLSFDLLFSQNVDCLNLLDNTRYLPQTLANFVGKYSRSDGFSSESLQFFTNDSVFVHTSGDIPLKSPLIGFAGSFSLFQDTLLVSIRNYVLKQSATLEEAEEYRKSAEREFGGSQPSDVYLLKKLGTHIFLVEADSQSLVKFCNFAVSNHGLPRLHRNDGKWFSDQFLLRDE